MYVGVWIYVGVGVGVFADLGVGICGCYRIIVSALYIDGETE